MAISYSYSYSLLLILISIIHLKKELLFHQYLGYSSPDDPQQETQTSLSLPNPIILVPTNP